MTRRIVVVGGGIAGLAGARRARLEAARLGLPLAVTLLEAGDRLGGKIRTEEVGDTTLEWGPDSLLAFRPRGRDLAEELGLGPELVTPGPAASQAYLLLGGRLRRLPSGMAMGMPRGPSALVAAVRAGILSWRGALRAAAEPFLPGRADSDGTVAEVTARRLGPEVARRLVGPLVAGVYGAPSERLGMAAVFPQFRDARSLALAARKMRRGSGPTFLTFRGGMRRLVDRLAEEVGREGVRTGTAVDRLAARDGGVIVAAGSEDIEADAVLVAVPSAAAAALLEGEVPEAARLLRRIDWAPSAVAHLRYPADAIRRQLDASGYLVAPEEQRVVAACTWLSMKWPHLGSEGIRVRAVVTGAPARDLEERELVSVVADEVGEALEADRPPDDLRIHRWDRAMPVYAPGHRDLVAAVRRSLAPIIEVAGASYDGVGVPDCARSGEEAASRLVAALAGSAAPTAG
jgi:protoporphyrinogen/coproporphyrinogen III oxidase